MAMGTSVLDSIKDLSSNAFVLVNLLLLLPHFHECPLFIIAFFGRQFVASFSLELLYVLSLSLADSLAFFSKLLQSERERIIL